MAKSYCPCKACTDFQCDDCVTCDICMAQTGCKDDIPDEETEESVDFRTMSPWQFASKYYGEKLDLLKYGGREMIGIKGFSMPKSCEDCKFYNDGRDIIEKITCKLTDADLSNEDSYTISDTCPLIEIVTK